MSLWLAEHQMNASFKNTFGQARALLPLKDGGKIACANATRVDWKRICPNDEDVDVYVLGNPPYMGGKYQSKSLKADMAHVFSGDENINSWIILLAGSLKQRNI
jgi:hypothetical protein